MKMDSSIKETESLDGNITDKLVEQIKSSRNNGRFRKEVDNVTLIWLFKTKALLPTEIKKILEADGIVMSLQGIIKRLKRLKVYMGRRQIVEQDSNSDIG